MNGLVQAVRQALARAGLWRDGALLLCAVSGGCDSAALLHALCRLRAQCALRLHAVHVQHGLRGEASLADERFVRSLCAALDVPLMVENAGLTGDMHTPGMETLARESRRRIFENWMAQLRADALLTAHHLDDQAETVLMHLLRGSGMQGLRGMPECAPFGGAVMVRPFLAIPKARLLEAMQAESLPFCQDESNQEAITPRNALRLSVMPALDALFPGAAQHIACAAEALAADEACLCAMADALYDRTACAVPPLFMLDAEVLAQEPEAIRRRVVRRWYQDGLRAAGLHPGERGLSHADTLALCALIHQQAGNAVNLPCGLAARRGPKYLHLLKQTGEALCPANPEPVIITPERTAYALAHLTLRLLPAGEVPQNALCAILPPDVLSQRPVLRTPRRGDTIHPFGAPGRKPLRRWLIDRKIDPALRPALTVLCADSQVLWVPGLCTAETLRFECIPPGSMMLTIEGSSPLIPNLSKE